MSRLSPLLLLLVACAGGQSAGGKEQNQASATVPNAAAVLPGKPVTPDQVVASWNGGQLTYADLQSETGGQVKKLEIEYLQNKFDLESGAVEQIVADKLLDAESKARSMDKEALLKAEVADKTPAATEEEIKSTMELMKRRMANAPEDKVREQTITMLKSRGESERMQAYIDELKTKYATKVVLPFPDLPRIDVSKDDDPTMGDPNAKVTIIQFAEFQCPYCGKAKETLSKVMKNYDGKVSMTFRDFPLGFHDRATPAAVAANCANEQGKYWEMFDELMSNQRALSDADLEGYATKAGVADMAKWKTCLADPSKAAEVEKDAKDGSAAGVTGTPAFFINGLMISGAQPYEKFASIIDRELGQG